MRFGQKVVRNNTQFLVTFFRFVLYLSFNNNVKDNALIHKVAQTLFFRNFVGPLRRTFVRANNPVVQFVA